MKFLFQLLILFICPHTILYAQRVAKVSGFVKLSQEETVNASVRLINKLDTTKVYTTTTSENGKFSIAVSVGLYSIEIFHIGCSTYWASVQVDRDVSLHEIIMTGNSDLMNEVVVTGRVITFNPNGYSADIARNPAFRNLDLDDILKRTPGTYAGLSEITVFGRRISKLYVNDREIHLSGGELIQYLKNFNGKNVKQIEVIAASGVEDDAAVAGSAVIKIITVTINDGGRLNIGASSTNGQSNHYSILNANTQWRRGKWSTYFLGSVSRGNARNSNETETDFVNIPNHVFTKNDGQTKSPGNMQSTIGLGYDLSLKDFFTLEGSYRFYKADGNSNLVTNQWNPQNPGSIQTTFGKMNDETRSNNYNGSLNYVHLFRNSGKLTIALDRIKRTAKTEQNNQYEYSFGDFVEANTLNSENNVSQTGGINYERPHNHGKSKLIFGLKYSNLESDINTDYVLFKNGIKDASSYIDIYHYKEIINAGFSKYSFAYKTLKATIGFRLEHASIKPISNINPERYARIDYTNLFPEAGINIDIDRVKGHSLSVQYNRSITRPAIKELNPFRRQVNDYIYNSGNPLLKPNFSNLYSLRLILLNKIIFNTTYNTYRNGAFTIGTTEPNSNIINIRPENGLKERNLAIYGEYPVKFKGFGQIKFTANYNLMHLQYQNDVQDNSRLNLGLRSTHHLPWGVDLMADMGYVFPSARLYQKSYNRLYSNLSFNKSIIKQKLNASLTFSDIFSSVGLQRKEFFYNEYSQKLNSTYRTFCVVVRISYAMNWGNKSTRVLQNNSGNDEEKARLGSD